MTSSTTISQAALISSIRVPGGRLAKCVPVVILLFCTFLSAQTTSPEAGKAASRSDPLHQFSDSIQGLSEQVGVSVVQILTSGYGISDSSHSNTTAVLSPEHKTGSGVILTPDGYIATNAHVVENARKITVVLNSSERERSVEAGHGVRGPLVGKLVGIDRVTDLAVIKVDAANLPWLPLADSADLRQGQIVLAFGSPLGLDNSVTMGVVSAMGRQINRDDPMIYIQTDAPINPGNSGGPLVDIDGRVVGINTFILTQSGGSEGLGFAIPSNIVRNVYQQLRHDGHVHRGQIGVYVRTITPALAKGLGLPREEGIILEDVVPKGPAGGAGLEVGDIVLTVAGRPVRNLHDFVLSLYRFKIGEPVPLVILRGDRQLTISVPVIERADDPQRFADMVNAEQNLIPKLGLMGLTLTEALRPLLPDLRIQSGVVVAARIGSSDYWGDDLQQGDVIHMVNNKGVADVASLRAVISTISPSIPLVLQIERDGILRYLVLEAD